ncbi:lysophospholipase-like protein 1 [Gigantopelta aegis]|uniref:lysophospholipase-like protein 1 n=1 Tax=Gigantopelta aegis TaxID=1735272 RepID=UPI001B88763C|nr:lysophospholipase-like protein 1 [Gigantopelta aegis]
MSASIVQKFRPLIIAQTNTKCTGSVIFLHGSGDTGPGIRQWLQSVLGEEFAFPHLRVIFPTAPPRPYSPMGGAVSTVWFDRDQISPFTAETESLTTACKEVSHLIEAEVKNGIPKNRIVIGGFSMGGCLALHLAYRFHKEIAGVFALSSFLQTESSVYKSIKEDGSSLVPLFQFHGKKDCLVMYEWGEDSFQKLKSLGVEGQFHTLSHLQHELNRKEIELLKQWIVEKVRNN